MSVRCWFRFLQMMHWYEYENIGLLLNTKHVYFVPFKQDNPQKKPNSMIASLEYLIPAAEAALGRQTVSTDHSVEKGKTMGTFTGFCSRNMGFAPGRCVEETEHAHPVTLKRPGRVCTLILNGELYNAKELGRELKADTDRNEELFLLAYMQYGPEFVKK